MTRIQVQQKINATPEQVWQTISSFENPERYIPIVTSSSITRNEDSAQRTCTVQLGDQQGTIVEKIESLDDKNKVLEFSVAQAPPPFKGLRSRYEILELEDGKTQVNISTNLENGQGKSAGMIEGIFQMVADGLKKLHEKEVN